MSETSLQPCYPHTITISATTNGIISLCSLTTSVFVLYKVYKARRNAIIFRLSSIFYSMCILHSICNAPYLMSNCYTDEMGGLWTQTILRFLRYFGYIYHWVSMLAVFFFRLKITFHGTILELTNRHQRTFFMVCCFITILFVINYGGMITGKLSIRLISASTAILVLFTTIYSQYLAFYFVRTLWTLSTSGTPDSNLIALITKQTGLAIFCVATSTLVVISFILFSRVVDDTDESVVGWFTFAARTSQSLDVLVDVICVSLGFSLFDDAYSSLCGAADFCLKSVCSRRAEKGSRKTEMQLAAYSSGESKEKPKEIPTEDPKGDPKQYPKEYAKPEPNEDPKTEDESTKKEDKTTKEVAIDIETKTGAT